MSDFNDVSQAVWKTRLKNCKCHGACSLRTCWQRMNDFRRIGDMLKKTVNRKRLHTILSKNHSHSVEISLEGHLEGVQFTSTIHRTIVARILPLVTFIIDFEPTDSASQLHSLIYNLAPSLVEFGIFINTNYLVGFRLGYNMKCLVL